MIEPPAGILYRTDNGLYITDGSGGSQLLLELIPGEYVMLSPDYSHALVIRMEEYLVDLKTGTKTLVWPLEGYNLCPFSWRYELPLAMISTLLPEGADPGYSCNLGSPVLMSLDGELTILEAEEFGWSRYRSSHNGQSIAYDIDGVPWIYDDENGPKKFIVTNYGFPNVENAYFSDPSWSPSGKKLAWTFIIGDMWADNSRQGIVILDLVNTTNIILEPYTVTEFEGTRPIIMWNSDETYIVMMHYIYDGSENSGILYELLSIDGKDARTIKYFKRWTPYSDLFIRENFLGPGRFRPDSIESLDGSFSFEVKGGNLVMWSPDYKQFISRSGDSKMFWLTEMDTLKTYQVNLPPNSEIDEWLIDSEYELISTLFPTP
jgi:hypothetical protein